MIVDCDRCEVRGDACKDCVITVLLGAPPDGIELDGIELDGIELDGIELDGIDHGAERSTAHGKRSRRHVS